MQEQTLSPDVVAAMIGHMNDDHAEAVLGYVHRFAALPAAESATLVGIDRKRMIIDAQTGANVQTVEIAFDHELIDGDDARDTLIAMARP